MFADGKLRITREISGGKSDGLLLGGRPLYPKSNKKILDIPKPSTLAVMMVCDTP